MSEKAREIFKIFHGKLVGSKRMQKIICETLVHFPEDIIKQITRSTWFISSMDDAWAFTFTGNDLKDQHLVFLSDDLLNDTPSQIRFSIAHEIGHIILKHRNSVFKKQTKAEIRKQEKEADEFARTYIFD